MGSVESAHQHQCIASYAHPPLIPAGWLGTHTQSASAYLSPYDVRTQLARGRGESKGDWLPYRTQPATGGLGGGG